MLTFAIKSRLFRRDSILLRFREVGRDFCMIKIVSFPAAHKTWATKFKTRGPQHTKRTIRTRFLGCADPRVHSKKGLPRATDASVYKVVHFLGNFNASEGKSAKLKPDHQYHNFEVPRGAALLRLWTSLLAQVRFNSV